MKHIASEMRSRTELFRHRRSLRAILKLLSCVSLLLTLLFIFNAAASSAPVSNRSVVVQHAPQLAADTSSSADIIIVVDNINEIKSHDPVGARFMAAQMLVDQVQTGDRIGVVRIPSSDKPSPVKLLSLTAIQKGNDRNAVKQVLTQSFFGQVDPGPVAYFVPAFQLASQMLLSAQDNHRKYIIVMTDTKAQSGDQESCLTASDQYHRWFCEVSTLESQNISVILYAFTTSGNEIGLQSIRQYLEQHGGIVLLVGSPF